MCTKSPYSFSSSRVLTLDYAPLYPLAVLELPLYFLKVPVERGLGMYLELVEHQVAALLHALLLQIPQDLAGCAPARPLLV